MTAPPPIPTVLAAHERLLDTPATPPTTTPLERIDEPTNPVDPQSVSASELSDRWRRAAWGLTLLTILYFLALVIHQYRAFENTNELASFDTILYSTLHGRFLESPPERYNFFCFHFSPILLLQLPIYALRAQASTLLLIHAVAGGLAVYPLWRLGQMRLSGEGADHGGLALCLAACYPLSRVINYGVLFGFHMEIFYPLLFLWAFVFLERQRWTHFFVFLLLALMVKEDAAIAGAGLGLYLLSRGRRRQGFWTLGISTVWVLLAVLVIIPAVQFDATPHRWLYFRHWTGSAAGTGSFNLSQLLKLGAALFTPEKLHKCFNVFLVFLFLPLVSWRGLLFLVFPSWFVLYSSNDPVIWGLSVYYGLLITPFLFYASLDGIQSLGLRHRKRRTILVGVVTVMFLINLGDSRIFRHLRPSFWHIPERVKVAEKMIERIPPGDPVSTQLNLQSRLPVEGDRWLLPARIKRSKWLLFDLEGNPYPSTPEENRRLFHQLCDSSSWTLIAEDAGYALLERASPGDSLSGNRRSEKN